MTKMNAKSAIATAKQDVKAGPDIAALLAALSPDQLAALLAGAGKAAPAKAEKPAKANDRATQFEDAKKFVGKLVKVTDGKANKGETVKVFFCSKMNANNTKSPVLRGEFEDGTIGFVKPANITVLKDMDKADADRLTAMQQAQSEETLYVAATCTNETEKAIVLSYSGWARKTVFWKANAERSGTISLTGFETKDGTKIFEVAAWQVRKMCGMDGYEALKAKQPALAAIVEAK